MVNEMINRKELHQIVDKLPENKLQRMGELLYDEDNEFNDATKREIEEGLKAYKCGEFVTLDKHLKQAESTDE
jgi:hypothetical protein